MTLTIFSREKDNDPAVWIIRYYLLQCGDVHISPTINTVYNRSCEMLHPHFVDDVIITFGC